MKDTTFKINNNGKLLEYTILKVLVPQNSKFQYLIYTDGKETFASRFDSINGEIILNPVEEDYEWHYIEQSMLKENENE